MQVKSLRADKKRARAVLALMYLHKRRIEEKTIKKIAYLMKRILLQHSICCQGFFAATQQIFA